MQLTNHTPREEQDLIKMMILGRHQKLKEERTAENIVEEVKNE